MNQMKNKEHYKTKIALILNIVNIMTKKKIKTLKRNHLQNQMMKQINMFMKINNKR